MEFFKSRFFIIMLCIALVLTVIPSVWALMGRTDLVRDAVGVVATPFRLCFKSISGGIRGFASYFGSVRSLREENDRLREEMQDYEEQKYRSDYLEKENEWLRSYLDLHDRYNEYTFAEATVISRESSTSAQIFTLNRGSLDGIDVNMPVVTADGVLGRVSEVGLNWCKVTGVLDASFSVGAIIERSGTVGIVEGSFRLKNNGYCSMGYMELDSDVQKGDIVVTSGSGKIFPAGLELGRVVEVSSDEFSRTKVATIRPYIDFADVNVAFVITGTSRAVG